MGSDTSVSLQFLFENGRVENIFMDPFYSKFSSEITNMLKSFKPVVTSSGEQTVQHLA